jgi:hypothetical protein
MRLKKPEQLIIILKKFYSISGSRLDKAMGLAPTRLAIVHSYTVVLVLLLLLG